MLKINDFFVNYPIITSSFLSSLFLLLLFVFFHLLAYYFPSFLTFPSNNPLNDTYFAVNLSFYTFYLFSSSIYIILGVLLLGTAQPKIYHYVPLVVLNMVLVFLTTYYMYELTQLPIAKPQGEWVIYPPLDIVEEGINTIAKEKSLYPTFVKVIYCLFGWQFLLLISLVILSFRLGKITY